MVSLLASPLLFFLIVYGLGWPLAARLRLSPAEKLTAAAGLSFMALFLLGWTIYVFALPQVCFLVAPTGAAFGLLTGWRELRATAQSTDARELLLGHALVTAGSLVALFSLITYSGGGWSADWFEHWERAIFFLQHGPLDQKFLGLYTLSARPPLVNVATGPLLWLTPINFAHYQVYTTLWSTLVFLPCALLVRHFGGGSRSTALLALALLLSPLYLQNATFAWTKLPSAFFVLGGIAFFLRDRTAASTWEYAALAGLFLSAGLAAHYSAAPYLVLLGPLWLWLAWRRALLGIAAGAVLLALWLGWFLYVYGAAGTLFSNTAVTTTAPSAGEQLVRALLNLRDSLVPHVIRDLDRSLVTHPSALGSFRDNFFQLYQLNVFFTFGSVAWVALLAALVPVYRSTAPRVRATWLVLCIALVLLGIGAHGGRDHWGLAHICLQPFVLFGLAFLVARAPFLSRPWRIALAAGAVIDLACGIVVHFVAQHIAVGIIFPLGELAVLNFAAKINHKLFFAGDYAAAHGLVLTVLAAAILGLALWRALRRERAS